MGKRRLLSHLRPMKQRLLDLTLELVVLDSVPTATLSRDEQARRERLRQTLAVHTAAYAHYAQARN